MQMAEAQAKVQEAQARAEKAKADAVKAQADAEKAQYEAKTAKANWAQAHMDNLRDVERHDVEMTHGHVAHEQDRTHRQDRHGADMTVLGLKARAAAAAGEPTSGPTAEAEMAQMENESAQ